MDGFTLIDTSISLIIFGMIMSVSLPFFTSMVHLEKQRRTEQHKEQICCALAVYVLENSCLPCASEPEKKGEVKGDNCLEDPAKCRGIIPYRALGISQDVAKDGYGHWFTYGVEPALTNTKKIGQPKKISKTDAASFYKKICEKIIIQDDHQGHKIDMIKKNIAFVLVSHGEEGAGAYLPSSSDKISVTHPYETINANDDFTYFGGKFSGYTHHVWAIDRSFFMGYYAKLPQGVVKIQEAKNENDPGKPSNFPQSNTNTQPLYAPRGTFNPLDPFIKK